MRDWDSNPCLIVLPCYTLPYSACDSANTVPKLSATCKNISREAWNWSFHHRGTKAYSHHVTWVKSISCNLLLVICETEVEFKYDITTELHWKIWCRPTVWNNFTNVTWFDWKALYAIYLHLPFTTMMWDSIPEIAFRIPSFKMPPLIHPLVVCRIDVILGNTQSTL